MPASAGELWERYRDRRRTAAGVTLDTSRIDFADDFFAAQSEHAQRALRAMSELEAGAIANPDEDRRVGHYWLRAPELAPEPEIREQISKTVGAVLAFARRILSGDLSPAAVPAFRNYLLIGIGGSALGPQLASSALADGSGLVPHFIDNTDPDGIDTVLRGLMGSLSETLVIVVSKSGGTQETRNGMLETMAAYRRQGVEFARHAVAVTGEGSRLEQQARQDGWLEIFPMWDWVGGRTSQFSAVGLLPAALEGIDVDRMLAGARRMDEATRPVAAKASVQGPPENIALLMALSWYHATGGCGAKAMVILPYKDRLSLLAKYLQQLVMESLGKKLDVDGNVVHQGITVYGNKGSTDQHSYVQQLRDGVANFFVTFVEVLNDREGESVEIETGLTTGDFLSGFLIGTREALYESGRESMTLTVEKIDARTFGALLALYERTVGFYASLIRVNAYHQPGVEAGKIAARRAVDLQRALVDHLRDVGEALSAEEIASALGDPDCAEATYAILCHLVANDRHVERIGDDDPARAKFRAL